MRFVSNVCVLLVIIVIVIRVVIIIINVEINVKQTFGCIFIRENAAT